MMVKEVWNLEEIKRKIEELPPRKKTAILRKFPHLAITDEELPAMSPEEVEAVWQHLEEDPPEIDKEAKKLTGDIWNGMMPIERERLGIKAKLDAERRSKLWIELFPEEKRALIREFKKEQLAIPDPPEEEIDKAKREAEAAKKRFREFAAKWEEREKRMAELPKEIEDIKKEIAVLERDIPEMAPGPLRTAAELELVRLERRLDLATSELERLTIEPKLAEEIKTLRTEIELVAKDLGDRFAKLEKAVAERVAVPPLEVERLKRMTEEIEAFRERLAATTMALSYGIPLGMAWKRLYEDRLWAERMRKGEVEITEEFASARNRFIAMHHIPTSETTVRVEPL